MPNPHSATPPTRELLLDPVTLLPLPSSHTHPRQEDDVDTSHLRQPTPLPASNSSPLTGSPFMGQTSSLRPTSGTLPAKSAGGSWPTIRACPSPSVASEYSNDVQSSEGTSSPPTPWTWPIAEAVASRHPILVPSLPVEIAETLSRRTWGDIPRQAVVVPIWAYEGDSSDSALPQAVLVLGLNPRRPYDKDYEEWIDLFRISLGASLAAVLSWEAEIQRAECVKPIFTLPLTNRCGATANLRSSMRRRLRFSVMYHMN